MDDAPKKKKEIQTLRTFQADVKRFGAEQLEESPEGDESVPLKKPTQKIPEQKKYIPPTSVHSDRHEVFDVSRAFNTNTEMGTIVTDKRRRHLSLLDIVKSAGTEWYQNIAAQFVRKEGEVVEPFRISPARERKEIIEKATTLAHLRPDDDHSLVVEKIKTLKENPETLKKPIIIKKPSGKKVATWTHTRDSADRVKEEITPKLSHVRETTSGRLEDQKPTSLPLINTGLSPSINVTEETETKKASAITMGTPEVTVTLQNVSSPTLEDTYKSGTPKEDVLKVPSAERGLELEASPIPTAPISTSVGEEVQQDEKQAVPILRRAPAASLPLSSGDLAAPQEPPPPINESSTRTLEQDTAYEDTTSLPDIQRAKDPVFQSAVSSEPTAVVQSNDAISSQVSRKKLLPSVTELPENTLAPVPHTSEDGPFLGANNGTVLGTDTSDERPRNIPVPPVDIRMNEEKQLAVTFIKLAAALVVIIIVLSAATYIGYLLFGNRGENTSAPIAPIETMSPIHVEKTLIIPFGTNKEAFLGAVRDAALQSTESVSRIDAALPTPAESGVHRADKTALLEILALPLSEQFARTLGEPFFFGSVAADDSHHPFLMTNIRSFDIAFTNMLSWEQTIDRDFAPLFSAPAGGTRTPYNTKETGGTTPTVHPPTFTSTIVRNTSVRILYDEQGLEHLVYAFPRRDLLIITDSIAALEALMERL